jgi:hypothetical protein
MAVGSDEKAAEFFIAPRWMDKLKWKSGLPPFPPQAITVLKAIFNSGQSLRDEKRHPRRATSPPLRKTCHRLPRHLRANNHRIVKYLPAIY